MHFTSNLAEIYAPHSIRLMGLKYGFRKELRSLGEKKNGSLREAGKQKRDLNLLESCHVRKSFQKNNQVGHRTFI